MGNERLRRRARNDPKGSVWRQWDLHFHTPSSFDYDEKSVSAQEIVDTLCETHVAAVAITDHHVMDVASIAEIKRLAGDTLTVFPGIELRSELGGRESVHYVGIFPEDADVEQLWTKLQGNLDMTPADLEEKGGDDRFYVPFEDGAQQIRDLGGIVTVHAGTKSNSIERIGNAESFKQQFKADIARAYIDILEIGKPQDADAYRTIVFPHIGIQLPLVIGSDCHNVKAYSTSNRCWIKADPTFAGLRQILNEPDGRVYLGDVPPSVERVNGNKTKYIKSVSFARSSRKTTTEAWFDGEVKFNHELVAIIGNKGGGKSALADVLGLLGDSSQSDSFSFLNEQKFRELKHCKARCFDATLLWESGNDLTRNLDDPVDSTSVEKVKYLPQNYLEQICNELNSQKGSDFDSELRSVIFSHVDNADRLGQPTLDALIDFMTTETFSAIEILQKTLREEIKGLVALQGRSAESHQTTVKNHLSEKKQELAAHSEAKPVKVAKPESDQSTQQRMENISRKIASAAKEVDSYEKQIGVHMVCGCTKGNAVLEFESLADSFRITKTCFVKWKTA